MERPVPMPRGNRPRVRNYYEGIVNKRGPRDQGYQRVWAGLRGLKLTFYRLPQGQEPLEVLDLGELDTVQAEGGALVLRLKGQQVTMKAESPETQEMWRAFILTMTKMRLPQDLALLPGQSLQLLDALREERERRGTSLSFGSPVSLVTGASVATLMMRPAVTPAVTPVSPGTPVVTPVSPATATSPVTAVSPVTPVSPSSSPSSSEPVPSCFFQVTRTEAERLLEQNAGRGNLLLRPGGHGRGLSISTRQELPDGTALLRHYKLKKEAQGYVIGLETPHRCSSLADAVRFFVTWSQGSLQPLELEYSTHLEFVPPAPNVSPPSPPAAAAPSPALRTGKPLSLGLVPEEQLYMNDPGSTHELLRELHKKLKLRQAQPKN